MNQKELEKFYKEECIPGLVKLYQDIFAELQGKENFYREEWLKQINTLFEQMCGTTCKVNKKEEKKLPD